MPDPKKWLGQDFIDEFSEAFSPYTKPKKNKKPPSWLTDDPPPKTGDTKKTTVIKPREDVAGVEVVKKWEDGRNVYQPTADSWLVKDTGQEYDFMTEGELKNLAKEAWEGSPSQELGRSVWERNNPGTSYEEHVRALRESGGERVRPKSEEEEPHPRARKDYTAKRREYTLDELIELADGDEGLIKYLKTSSDPQRAAIKLGIIQ